MLINNLSFKNVLVTCCVLSANDMMVTIMDFAFKDFTSSFGETY